MESDQFRKEENERINKLITDLKKTQIDNYFKGNYCDALDDAKHWCVAEVILRQEEKIKIHFDGWSDKFDEVLSVKSRKITHFRRFSKGYTGQKGTAYRLYTFRYEDFLEIQNLIKLIKETNFECLGDPLEATQVLRGKIFNWVDIFMTCPFPTMNAPSPMNNPENNNSTSNESNNPAISVPQIVELLYDFIDLFIVYLNFYKSNLYMTEVLEKHPDIVLVDRKAAIMSCYFEFIVTLKRIFGRDERTNIFMRTYEHLILKYCQRKKIKDQVCSPDSYKSNKTFSNIPVLIISNFIDYFHHLNGFNLIFEIIFSKFPSVLSNNNSSLNSVNTSNSYVTTSFFTIFTFFQIFEYVNPFVDFTNQFSNELSKFKDYIFFRINNMSEQEIKETDKHHIEGIAFLIKHIYNFDGEGIASSIINEELLLNYAFKCFVSKNLEKRIKGISHIDKVVEDVYKKEITYIDINYLFSWMNEKKILEVILGETIHEEILKRTTNIFLLYVRKQSLPNNVYDLMWRALVEKHESIAKEIEGLLCELSLAMNQKDKIYIFDKIKLIDLETYNEDLLKFVKNLTINCIRTESDNYKDNFYNQIVNINLYGIPLLWNFFLDFSDHHSNRFVKTSLECLSEIFVNCSLQEEVITKYLILCLENIQSSQSVVQSIKLFKILIAKEENLVKVIDGKYSIIDLVINDFQRYFVKVNSSFDYIKEAQNLAVFNSSESKEFMTRTFEGFYSHFVNIETRLDILSFLCKMFSGIDLTLEHITKLWNILILNSRTENEKHFLYKFLLQSNESGGYSDELSDEIIEGLFLNILTNPVMFNPTKFSFIAFKLFQKFFNLVNINKEKIFIIHRKIRVCSSDLLGINTLWDILTNCRNENVRGEASKLLVTLCLNPRHIREELCIQIWTQFISKLIITLQNNLSNETGIKGIILLIKQIICELNSDGEIAAQDDLVKYTNTLPVLFVNTTGSKNDKKTIHVGLNELVFEVRDKISFYFEIPLQHLAFKNNRKIIDMNDDEKFFREVFDANYVVEIIIRKNPILEFKNINPKVLVMENKFIFETLFELLHNSKASYIDDAWELINMLPKNRLLEEEIFKLGEKPVTNIQDLSYNKFLDSESIYKMSYSLQIVKTFTDKSFTWVDNFNKNEGFTNLIKVINALSEDHFLDNSKLAFQCLNDIFYIFNSSNEYYAVNKEQNLFELESIGKCSQMLINKLFYIIYFIFKASYIKDGDKKLQDLQHDYSRRRSREIIHRLYLKNQNKEKEKESETMGNTTGIISIEEGEIDEIHPTLRNLWNNEINNMNTILKFLSNFTDDNILQNLINTNDISNNVLKLLLTWCLIFPKNAKLKYSLFDYIFKLVNSTSDSVLQNSLYIKAYHIIFNTETLSLPHNISSEIEPFFRIVLILLSNCKPTADFINKHSDLLSINFIQVTEFMIGYIDNDLCEQNEEVLIGYLSILREMVLVNEDIHSYLISRNFIDLLMNKCLFSKCRVNSSRLSSPKCKTSSGRYAAYRLLSAISYNNAEFINKIVTLLTKFHDLGYWRSKRLVDWNNTPAEDKSTTGFTGLKNLGCTCYMNSLMQQFYMIPSLRKGILSTPDNSLFPIEESVLFHLKTIFASLQASDDKFFNPKDFCMNFKNYEGQAMNVLEQMDVDEFFNLLLDRLEPYMKGTENEHLFQDHFTGRMSNELICQVCPYSSENKDPFSSIILQVKNKKSIIESLEAYVKGDLLEGDNAYYCEKCDKKVNTIKRQSIKKLPKILVLVLKRFEFDYNTMLKVKVNDYCEFPMELDMEPYTQHYLSINKNNKSAKGSNPNCKYSLSGVVIHTGTADSGHYYSIIKSEDKWFEFNDTYVTPYDITDLPNEAFGGVISTGNDNLGNLLQEKSTNAYVLFYTKNNDDDFNADVEMKNGTNDNKNDLLSNHLTENIQSNILDTITTHNYQFWVSKIVFSNEYNEFIQDLLINFNLSNNQVYKHFMITKNQNTDVFPITRKFINNLNIPESFFVSTSTGINNFYSNNSDLPLLNEQVFKFACKVFFTTAIRYKDRNYIPSFMDIIKTNINLYPTNAEWLLEEFSNYDLISEFLVECPFPEMRKLSAGLLYCAMIKSHNYDKDNIDGALYNFIQAILYLLCRKKQFTGKDFTHLYFILWRFSLLRSNSKQYLVDRKVIQFLIAYFKSKSIISNLPNSNPTPAVTNLEDIMDIKLREPKHRELNIKQMPFGRKEKMSALEEFFEKKQLEKHVNQSDVHLLLTLCEILNSSDIKLSEEDKQIVSFADYDHVKLLVNESKTRQGAIHLANLFSSVCKENIENTNTISAVILDMINNSDASESDNLMRLFKAVVMIEDSLQKIRISTYMNKYLSILIDNCKYYKFTEYHIDFIIKFFNKYYEKFEPYIDNLFEYFLKLVKWLKENSYAPLYTPSKTTVMFKKRPINYSNININHQSLQLYIQNYKDRTEVRIMRLVDIAKKNISNENGLTYESDEDLTDFKFSVKDTVRFENFECNVSSVLDEMMWVEYTTDLIAKRKLPNNQWVETDKNISIIKLYQEDEQK